VESHRKAWKAGKLESQPTTGKASLSQEMESLESQESLESLESWKGKLESQEIKMESLMESLESTSNQQC